MAKILFIFLNQSILCKYYILQWFFISDTHLSKKDYSERAWDSRSRVSIYTDPHAIGRITRSYPKPQKFQILVSTDFPELIRYHDGRELSLFHLEMKSGFGKKESRSQIVWQGFDNKNE